MQITKGDLRISYLTARDAASRSDAIWIAEGDPADPVG
jgi:hypothetical protein